MKCLCCASRLFTKNGQYKGKGREGRELTLLMRFRPESECGFSSGSNPLNGATSVLIFRRHSSSVLFWKDWSIIESGSKIPSWSWGRGVLEFYLMAKRDVLKSFGIHILYPKFEVISEG